MKLRTREFQSIVFEGRHIDFFPEKEYEIMDSVLVSFLLKKGFESAERKEFKKGFALKSDRSQISMEDHEQRYMKDKIKNFNKKKLIMLYEKTQEEQDLKVAKDYLGKHSSEISKKVIIKMIAEEFAKINDRKKVNAIIKEIKEGGDIE